MAWAVTILSLPVYFVVSYYLVLPLMASGVALAASLMKFELPENARWRALAAFEVALLFALGLSFLALVVGLLGVGVGGTAVGGAAFIAMNVICVLTLVPMHFLLLKFFFRLHMAEAVMAYVFQFMILLALNAAVLGIMLAVKLS
jgi:hypothetical protein